FGVQGEDADLLGRELGALSFDPMRVKDEIYHTRQRLKGHEIRKLKSWSDSRQDAETWSETYGESRGRNESKTNHPYNNDPKLEVRGEGDSRSDSKSKSTGKNTGYTTTHGTTEHLVPVHEEVSELASRTFVSGDEWDRV